MIQRTFGVADGSCGMVRCKRESLIPDTAADKELNATADEAVDADKGQTTKRCSWAVDADKEPNNKADEARRLDRSRINSWTNPVSIR